MARTLLDLGIELLLAQPQRGAVHYVDLAAAIAEAHPEQAAPTAGRMTPQHTLANQLRRSPLFEVRKRGWYGYLPWGDLGDARIRLNADHGRFLAMCDAAGPGGEPAWAPEALIEELQRRMAALPGTEVRRTVDQRVGQDLFREILLAFWKGRCAITGLAVPELLRASHAKPWKDCATDAERLDVHNGLLLAAHLDAAFDAGLLTVEDDGRVIVSPALEAGASRMLGLYRPNRVRGLADAHRPYLAWHRQHVFMQYPPG